MGGYLVVFCTVPGEEVGTRIARTLVEEKLAACCNLVRGLRSIYFWKGEVCDDAEVLMVIKTREEVFPQLEQRIRALHPYTVPEIIGLPIVAGHQPYLNWVSEHVQQGKNQ